MTVASPTRPPAAGRHPDEVRSRELVERSRSLVFDQPAEALAAAQEAARLAEGLPPSRDPARQADLADLKAEAWGYLGNAQRVTGDLDAAEASLDRAMDEASSGTGEPLLGARLASLQASVVALRERPAQAHELLRRALALCDGRDEELRIRLLLQKSYLLIESEEDRAGEALPALREALRLVRPHEQLRLFVWIAHNLASALHKVGYSIAARSLIAELRPLHERLGDRVTLLRLEWLEARIDEELGLAARAEEKLRRVRDALLEQGVPYDAALVSLDLAALYAGQHRFPEIRQLAMEMLPIFQSRRIHREALAALILFRESIAGGRADLAFVGEVRRYLLRARHDRNLRFRRS
jgi:tetratricopeptide (TPR) repeat protein